MLVDIAREKFLIGEFNGQVHKIRFGGRSTFPLGTETYIYRSIATLPFSILGFGGF